MATHALIIFDIDGTLLETDLVTVPAVQRTYAAYGLAAPDAAAICATFGRPVEEYIAWLASLCPPGRADEIIAATNRLELELVGTEGRLYAGVLEMLDTLKGQGHVLAICSNGPDDYVNAFLDAHDVRRFFDIVRTRGTKYEGKISMIREILTLTPARPAIVVGDRADDIEAAHTNAALAVAACYGFGNAKEWEQADACITRPDEVAPLIERL